MPAATEADGWVMAPVLESVRVPGVKIVPVNARSPVTVRLAAAADNGPETARDCPSASVKPPVVVNWPKVATAFPRPSVAAAALPVSVPAETVPPGWVTVPNAKIDRVPGVVIVPASVRLPATTRLADDADTGPDTVSACAVVSAKVPVVANAPSVPTALA